MNAKEAVIEMLNGNAVFRNGLMHILNEKQRINKYSGNMVVGKINTNNIDITSFLEEANTDYKLCSCKKDLYEKPEELPEPKINKKYRHKITGKIYEIRAYIDGNHRTYVIPDHGIPISIRGFWDDYNEQ